MKAAPCPVVTESPKARSAALIIHDFCVAQGIPIAIYGHTEDYDVGIYSYAGIRFPGRKGYIPTHGYVFPLRKQRRRALRFAAERLMTRAEDLEAAVFDF